MAGELLAMSRRVSGPLLILAITTLQVGGHQSKHTGGARPVRPEREPPPTAPWCSIVGYSLTGHAFNNITATKTHKSCWDACELQPRCVSCNYATGSGRCELNNATHYDAPGCLTLKRGFVYAHSHSQCVGRGSDQALKSGTICPKEKRAQLSWPLGTYGLPMPIAGCPTNGGFTWETGFRFHDTENSLGPSNEWSENLHLQGPYANNDMQQNFCMKTVGRVSNGDAHWPRGQYCIFKFDDVCPKDMSSGYIKWDDQDTGNANKVGGTVPSGEYNKNTRVEYCCMTDGDPSRPIALPTHSPFYLFAFTAQCQEVRGLNVSQEWFKWDDEDIGNTNEVHGSHPYDTGGINHIIHYCYYEPM